MNAASLVLLALLAQTAPPTASPEARARAQALLKEGAKLYEKGELAPALEKFTQAYMEYKSPKLLFNIGQTSRDLGRLAEAMDAFERFLAEATDAPADMTAEAKKSVVELQVKLGRLQLECSIPGAEVSVDGKLVGLAPLTNLVWATPGTHQVTARHPTFAPAIEYVLVSADSIHKVSLWLLPLAKRVVAAPVATPPVAPAVELAAEAAPAAEPAPAVEPAAAVDLQEPLTAKPAKAGKGFWLGRKWTWVAAGSAVVFAGTATFFGISMKSKFDSLSKSCGGTPKGCSDPDINSVLARRNTANVFWGLTGAAALTAGVLFFVEGRSVSVTPMAGEFKGLVAEMAY